MRLRAAFLFLVAGLLLQAAASPALAGGPEEAAKAVARGNSLLAGGDFAGAEAAFTEASKLDPAGAAARGELDVLRRVMKLRSDLAAGGRDAQWERTYPALRAYYYSKGIFGEALNLDQRAYERAGTPANAALLAETLLELNRDAEAAALLAGLPSTALPPSTRMLQGIALARTGDPAGARRVADEVPLPFAATPNLMVLRARLLAGAGEHASAIALIAKAFEATPPALMDQTRERVRGYRDFAPLAASAEFAQALATPTKVAGSSCSMGPSCGSCPSRTSCGSAGASGGQQEAQGSKGAKTGSR